MDDQPNTAATAAPAEQSEECYWCKHPDHGNKVCPVPYLARGEGGIVGSYPCGCTLSSPATAASVERLFETKLLGFENEWRIRLCEPCVRRATEDNFVIHACALPLDAAPDAATADDEGES